LSTLVQARARSGPRLPLSQLGWGALILCLGVAIALPSPELAVVGAVGLAAAVLMVIQPVLGLPLLLLAVPFGGLARGGASDPAAATRTELSFGAAELLVGLLALVWLLRGVRLHGIRIRPGAIVVTTLAMIALALLSIGYANDKSAAIKEALKWLELWLALVIVVDIASQPRSMRLVIGSMFVAAGLEAAYGIYQFATESGPSAFALQGALRAFGHFDQPNPFAGYLTMVLPLTATMALCQENSHRFRWLAGLCGALIFVAVALSQSRGAWLGGAMAGLCLLLAWSRATRRLLVPLGLGAVIVLILALSGVLPASMLDRLSQAIDYFGVFDVRTVDLTSDNWSVVERMAHWQAGWYMFLDHPWFGVGAGNYADAYPAYYVGPWREALGHAHNYYLNMLAELGIVGGGILLLLLGIVFVRLGGPLVRTEQRSTAFARAVLAGVFGGLIVFCMHNLFDNLFVHSVNLQVGVLIGLGLLATDHLRSPSPAGATN
jgi:putative inorganic carbon (HCO3(-)) transporter